MVLLSIPIGFALLTVQLTLLVYWAGLSLSLSLWLVLAFAFVAGMAYWGHMASFSALPK